MRPKLELPVELQDCVRLFQESPSRAAECVRPGPPPAAPERDDAERWKSSRGPLCEELDLADANRSSLCEAEPAADGTRTGDLLLADVAARDAARSADAREYTPPATATPDDEARISSFTPAPLSVLPVRVTWPVPGCARVALGTRVSIVSRA